MSRLRVLLTFLMLPAAASAEAFDLDAIDYWIGEGPNRAALVIDWSPAAGEGDSTAWGYRWSGSATGLDMVEAVATADPRLFAKTNLSRILLYGLGYDELGPDAFAVTNGTPFTGGLATSAIATNASATSPEDHYAEGFGLTTSGFWLYLTAGDSPFATADSWHESQVGLAARPLTDGAWDAWVFDPGFTFAARPDTPASATLPGDYNLDGRVDAADYTVWRDTPGHASHYLTWRDNYGATTTNPVASAATTQTSTNATPEPASGPLSLSLFVSALLPSLSRKLN